MQGLYCFTRRSQIKTGSLFKGIIIYQASERDFKICVVEDRMSRLDSQGIDELKNIGVHILSKNEVIRQINNKKYAYNLV